MTGAERGNRVGATERTFESVVSTPGPHSRESEKKLQHILLYAAEILPVWDLRVA